MDVLTDVLRRLQVRGSVGGELELGAPWSLAVPAMDQAMFHIVSREAELVEGDGDLDDVAGGSDSAGRIPDQVEGPVLDPFALAVEGVGLDSQGVDPELKGPALVVKGVERENNVVVLDQGIDRIAVHQVSPDLAGARVVAAPGDVEVRVVVGDHDVGWHGWLDVVAGGPLVADAERQGVGPGGLVKDAVDLDRAVRRASCPDYGLGASSV